MTAAKPQQSTNFDTRIKQAKELGVDVNTNMTLNCLEKEIVEKLALGMEDLKVLIEDISQKS